VVLCNDVEEPHAKAHLAVVNRVFFRELVDEPPKRRRLRRRAHDHRTLRGELRAKQAPDSARTKPLPRRPIARYRASRTGKLGKRHILPHIAGAPILPQYIRSGCSVLARQS